MTYAKLQDEEEATGNVFHDALYLFKYDKNDNFYIRFGGQWHEDVSTAFYFLDVIE